MTKIRNLLFVLALELRLLQITSRLWYDENFTLLVTRLPFRQMMTAILGDVHPPLYYLLVRPIALLNGPEWTIRIPSVIFSMLALWIFWLILQEMNISTRLRWIAFVGMVLMPQQIYYGSEGRMYALLTFLVLLGWLSILRRCWLFFGLAAVLLVWTHNYGLFYVPALWLAGMVLQRGKTWRPLTMAAGLAGLSWLPWVTVLLKQMTYIEAGYWILDSGIGNAVYHFMEMIFSTSSLFGANVLMLFTVLGVLAFSLTWGILRNRMDLSLVILAFFPWTAALVASYLWQPVMLYRALVPSGPFLMLILLMPTELFSRLWQWAATAIVILPIVITSVLSVTMFTSFMRTSAESITTLQGYIERHWQDGDIVYHFSDGTLFNVLPYTPHPEDQQHFLPCAPVKGSLSSQTRDALLGHTSFALEDLYWKRAWVWEASTPLNPLCEQDELVRLTSGRYPLRCLRDDELTRICLYLVVKP